MGWESKVANQMLSCPCLFKNSPSWMALVALFLLFSSYLLVGFGYFSILYTSLVVIFSSTVFYTVSKHKAVDEVGKLEKEKVLSPEEESSDQRENIIAPTPNPLCKHETVTEAKEAQKDAIANYSTPSPPDLKSAESEYFQEKLSTSEESEVDWPIHRSPDCSDGSISDEESLIEIALPGGHYVGQHNNCSLQQKKRELSAEAFFRHQSLMEFLSELNDVSEEENLIEIDISMGSIKYSRFEIKA